MQPAFDSMIAKLIVHADDRDAALVRARRALRELWIEGPATVVPFDRLAVDQPEFATETFGVHTQWIESTLFPRLEPQLRPAPLEDAGMQRFGVEIDGKRVVLGVPAALLRGFAAASPGEAVPDAASADPASLHAPAPGSLVRWLVDDGAEVAAGDAVAVLDAMKMETQVTAHRAGTMSHAASVGDMIAADAVIGRIA